MVKILRFRFCTSHREMLRAMNKRTGEIPFEIPRGGRHIKLNDVIGISLFRYQNSGPILDVIYKTDDDRFLMYSSKNERFSLRHSGYVIREGEWARCTDFPLERTTLKDFLKDPHQPETYTVFLEKYRKLTL